MANDAPLKPVNELAERESRGDDFNNLRTALLRLTSPQDGIGLSKTRQAC